MPDTDTDKKTEQETPQYTPRETYNDTEINFIKTIFAKKAEEIRNDGLKTMVGSHNIRAFDITRSDRNELHKIKNKLKSSNKNIIIEDIKYDASGGTTGFRIIALDGHKDSFQDLHPTSDNSILLTSNYGLQVSQEKEGDDKTKDEIIFKGEINDNIARYQAQSLESLGFKKEYSDGKITCSISKEAFLKIEPQKKLKIAAAAGLEKNLLNKLPCTQYLGKQSSEKTQDGKLGAIKKALPYGKRLFLELILPIAMIKKAVSAFKKPKEVFQNMIKNMKENFNGTSEDLKHLPEKEAKRLGRLRLISKIGGAMLTIATYGSLLAFAGPLGYPIAATLNFARKEIVDAQYNRYAKNINIKESKRETNTIEEDLNKILKTEEEMSKNAKKNKSHKKYKSSSKDIQSRGTKSEQLPKIQKSAQYDRGIQSEQLGKGRQHNRGTQSEQLGKGRQHNRGTQSEQFGKEKKVRKTRPFTEDRGQLSVHEGHPKDNSNTGKASIKTSSTTNTIDPPKSTPATTNGPVRRNIQSTR